MQQAAAGLSISVPAANAALNNLFAAGIVSERTLVGPCVPGHPTAPRSAFTKQPRGDREHARARGSLDGALREGGLVQTLIEK